MIARELLPGHEIEGRGTIREIAPTVDGRLIVWGDGFSLTFESGEDVAAQAPEPPPTWTVVLACDEDDLNRALNEIGCEAEIHPGRLIGDE